MSGSSFSLLLAAVLCSASTVLGQPQPCTDLYIPTPSATCNGKTIDLSKLIPSDGAEYFTGDDRSGHKYALTVKPPSDTPFKGCPSNGGRYNVFQESPAVGTCYYLGDLTGQAWSYDATKEELTIAYTGGQLGRATVLKVKCDKEAVTPQFIVEGELSPLRYEFVLKTNLVCSNGPAPTDAVYIAPFGRDEEGAGSSTSPFKTLGYAAKHAEGGKVLVMPGVYTGSENFVNLDTIVPENKTLVVQADTQGSPMEHLFDAITSSSLRIGPNIELVGLAFSSGSSSGIIGAYGGRITGCLFTKVTGRAIYLNALKGSFEIENTSFNFTTNYVIYGSSLTTQEHSVSLKNVNLHGTKKAIALYMEKAPLYMEKSRVENATTAITSRSTVDIVDSVFVHNTRFISTYTDPVEVTLKGVTVTKTKCSSCNGAVISAGSGDRYTILTSTFTDNEVSGSSYGKGGVFYCESGATINVQDSTVNYNKAVDGAAGYCDPNCGFIGYKVSSFGNVDEKNTHPCDGLGSSKAE